MESRIAVSTESALEFAKNLKTKYGKDKHINMWGYYITQTLAIVLAGISPVILLEAKEENGSSNDTATDYAALLSTGAAITTGVGTIFKFKEKYDRNSRSLDKITLEIENYKFGTCHYRQQSKTNGDADNTLMQRLEKIDGGVIDLSLPSSNTGNMGE